MEADLPRGTAVLPEVARVFFDGACTRETRGGIATYGFTVETGDARYEEKGLAVPPWSEHATNNVAEYAAALRALEYLRARGFRGQVLVFGDSQLVIRQMKGEYAVRAPHLRAYHEHLTMLERQFAGVEFAWVPRTENRRADALSKEAFAAALAELGPNAGGRPEDLPAGGPEP